MNVSENTHLEKCGECRRVLQVGEVLKSRAGRAGPATLKRSTEVLPKKRVWRLYPFAHLGTGDHELMTESLT
jgi:hypothetical protein